MEDNTEDVLKNEENLCIAGRHTALDIFRFAVILKEVINRTTNNDHPVVVNKIELH